MNGILIKFSTAVCCLLCSLAVLGQKKPDMLHKQHGGAQSNGITVEIPLPKMKPPVKGLKQLSRPGKNNKKDYKSKSAQMSQTEGDKTPALPNMQLPKRSLKELTMPEPDKGALKRKSNEASSTKGDGEFPRKNFKLPIRGIEPLTMPEVGKIMEVIKSKQIVQYSGSINARNRDEKKRKSDQLFKHNGEINLDAIVEKRKETSRKISGSTGDIDYDAIVNKRKSKSQELSRYSGDLDNYLENRKALRKKKGEELAAYSGDMGNNFLIKRKEFRKEQNRKISTYSGDILVKSLEAKKAAIRKKTREMASYQGDFIIARKKKGMHPSAVYMGGRVQNSISAKEKYRKKMLKRYHKKRDSEDSDYFKEKPSQPKYMDAEYKIWYK